MSQNVDVILHPHALLGEGPRWHAPERRLYWVDIARNELHRTDPETGVDEVRTFDAPVGCIAFRKSGGFVLAMKDGCALLDSWNAQPAPFGPQIFAGRPYHRFNDGRTDAKGRFWVGSLNGAKDEADAALYRLDADATLTEIEGGMMTCNGAAFSADGSRFHHSDTPSHAVRAYDVVDGKLSNRHVLHQFTHGVGPGLGRPDGGSFDEAGNYWCAMFDGHRVVCLSPAGDIIDERHLPASRPTMIAFGGDDRRTAYVTSARTGLSEDQLAAEPLAGALFAFRVDTPGVAEQDFAG